MKKLSIKPDFEQICASSVAWLQSFKHFFRSGETQLARSVKTIFRENEENFPANLYQYNELKKRILKNFEI